MDRIKWINKYKKVKDTLAGIRVVNFGLKTMSFSQDMIDIFGEKVNIGIYYDSAIIYFRKGDINGFEFGGPSKNRIRYPRELENFICPFIKRNIGMHTLLLAGNDVYCVCLEV